MAAQPRKVILDDAAMAGDWHAAPALAEPRHIRRSRGG
jgi:hypothetical protein